MKSINLKAVIFIAATNMLFLSSPLAIAQTLPNVLGDPHYGFVEFGSTSSSSISKEISAGGSFDLSEMNANYDGYISSIPDLQMTYNASSAELTFTVESDNSGDDTVLLIFSPSGEFLFNDDFKDDEYASEITIDDPESGNYAIWIGNYDGEDYIPTTLTISERGNSDESINSLTSEERAANRESIQAFILGEMNSGNSDADQSNRSYASFDELDISEDPYYGDITLKSGFTPDPYIKTITAGGSVDLSSYGHSGYAADKPDIDFYFTPSGDSYDELTISARSDTDTILLINDPDGVWFFSDDADGVNPAIVFENPKNGLYSIFVGTYDSETAEAELLITEL